MSKAKLEKDFQEFNLQIEKLAEEEIKDIKEKADAVQAEAAKVGAKVEVSIKETKAK